MKVSLFDHCVFKWCEDNLRDAKTPDEICNFYVQKFVFGNGKYLERITQDYKLPNDFLKLHKRVVVLANEPYEAM